MKTHGQPPRHVAAHLQYSGPVAFLAFNNNHANTTHKLARPPASHASSSSSSLPTQSQPASTRRFLHAAAIGRIPARGCPHAPPPQGTVSPKVSIKLRGQNTPSRIPPPAYARPTTRTNPAMHAYTPAQTTTTNRTCCRAQSLARGCWRRAAKLV